MRRCAVGKACVLNVDLADVWEEKGRKTFLRTIAWGDEISVLNETSTHIEISTTVFRQQPDGGTHRNRSQAISSPVSPPGSRQPTS